jgi:prepilin-type N-terminal cleavage/methylation domain-containing protein
MVKKRQKRCHKLSPELTKTVINRFKIFQGEWTMSLKKENGFSLIELLVVVVIIGIIASLAVPALRKSIRATENQSAFSALRTMGQAQANYYSQGNRYARLDELNVAQNGALGTTSGAEIFRGPFRFTLTSDPSDATLQNSYTILAARPSPGDVPYVISVDQSGVITQIVP